MLGNFSFGDYFKEAAIPYAWDLVTKDYGLPKDRLLVTVFAEDDDAAAIWKKVAGLPDDRIIRIPTSDNFWRMGDTGPCGPCSEIFYDHGDHIPGGPPGSPDEDGDRFIEIWNLVFMQFEEGPPGTRVPLPRPSIDTGMGLERIAAILQGKHDNYDIDIFRALILASAEATGQDPDGPYKTSHRVIADHLRSTSFLMADGVLPSNEGRGYVLRRIMRRAMRHATMMGANDPVMHRLVPALIRQMGAAYPELGRAEALITETLLLEETRFKHLLERGLHLLSEETARLGDNQALPGPVAFRLYDTYGFPLDLTQDALREQGRAVDLPGSKRRCRNSASAPAPPGPDPATPPPNRSGSRSRRQPAPPSSWATPPKPPRARSWPSSSTAPRRHRRQPARMSPSSSTRPRSTAKAAARSATPAPSPAPTACSSQITDTQKKLGDLFVHLGRVEAGTAKPGTPVVAIVDHARRSAIRAHHSATHLLHEALRRKLGTHVQQKGSLNAPDRLRFDVSQPRPITADELHWVEAEVNARIRENSEVTTRLMTPEAAVELGAMALFGEKYGDEVRVVAMGEPDGNKPAWSIELCGGTHVRRTGDIGYFRIVGESAVAAGVRRIEAVTGASAEALVAETQARLNDAAGALRAAPAEVPTASPRCWRIAASCKPRSPTCRKKLATGGGAAAAEDISGVKLAARNLGEVPAARPEGPGRRDRQAARLRRGRPGLHGRGQGQHRRRGFARPHWRISAVDLVRAASAAVGGKGGGGRPDLAQAGGPDGDKAEDALAAVRAALG